MLITDDMKDAWLQTSSGAKFTFFDPQVLHIRIEDIAASLSKQCRFNGHTKDFYSVAQHSIYVCDIVTDRAKPWALMHDGYEAYVSDIVNPMKVHLPLVKEAEHLGQEALIDRFNIPIDDKIEAEVHAADRYMVFREAAALLPNPELIKEWGLPRIPFYPQQEIGNIVGWPWQAAERLFLERFRELFHK